MNKEVVSQIISNLDGNWCTIKEMKEAIKTASKLSRQGWANFRFDTSTNYGNPIIRFIGDRPFTKQELERKAEATNAIERRERETYERLKRKFGNKDLA